jgi:hypothetical protein
MECTTTAKSTVNSNAMPYSGFDNSSVKRIFDSFYSLLNNNELKLITKEDAFRWLGEAYSTMKSELNLINEEYNSPTEWSFTVTSTVNETALPTNFSDIISLTTADGNEISSISLRDKRYWDNNSSTSEIRYYLRGANIGISPTPTSTATYWMYYKANATIPTSYYDNLDIPENGYFILVDGMLSRAAIKITRLDKAYHEEKFKEGLSRMKTNSFKRNNTRESWDIISECNI